MTPEAQSIYEDLQPRLGRIVPDSDLRRKAELAAEINVLKKERNAVILGHNYMEPVLFHTVPDFRGDSLDLSRKAAQTDKDVIVFCGVEFMAETAKILSPGKTVLLPAEKAGCSLAESVTAGDVRNLKRKYPGAPVVSYVNTYADVKAESDICCTSGNAVAVVDSLKADTVIFLPDRYLAGNVARKTGKHIVFPALDAPIPDTLLDVQLIGWGGTCEVHERFTVEHIRAARAEFSDVVVLTHPECPPEVAAASDFSGSTNAMIQYVRESKARRFLVLTESAMVENIAAAHPEKEFSRRCMERCRHMDAVTLENVRDALRRNRRVIDIPEEIRVKAFRAVDRMIRIG